MTHRLSRVTLRLLIDRVAVCRFPLHGPVPRWVMEAGGFLSVTRTDAELSVVCDEAAVPDGIACERGFRVFQAEGPLPFSTTGVVAALSVPLADAGIPVFVISTYDTDYLLVKAEFTGRAAAALRAAGHRAEVPGEGL